MQSQGLQRVQAIRDQNDSSQFRNKEWQAEPNSPASRSKLTSNKTFTSRGEIARNAIEMNSRGIHKKFTTTSEFASVAIRNGLMRLIRELIRHRYKVIRAEPRSLVLR